MTRRKLYIPEEVKEKIRQHLSEKYPTAIDGYFSANEEEDTLTGDLGATLRIKNQKVIVYGKNEFPGSWTWSIDYHKFRGRGQNATENSLGADGIFEITLKTGNRVEKKSLLFQSKMNWQNDPNLIKQAIKLSTWREASFLLNYTSTEFEAITLDSVIQSRGKRTDTIITKSLDKFLGNDFLDCFVGDTDLKYDAVSRKLIWRTIDGEIVATKFSIPQKIAVKIVAPSKTYGNEHQYDKEIKNDEIHDYRMDASEEDILSLNENFSEKDIRKARTNMALIYHSDTQIFNDQLLDELMKRRMQEINKAHEILKSKYKR